MKLTVKEYARRLEYLNSLAEEDDMERKARWEGIKNVLPTLPFTGGMIILGLGTVVIAPTAMLLGAIFAGIGVFGIYESYTYAYWGYIDEAQSNNENRG